MLKQLSISKSDQKLFKDARKRASYSADGLDGAARRLLTKLCAGVTFGSETSVDQLIDHELRRINSALPELTEFLPLPAAMASAGVVWSIDLGLRFAALDVLGVKTKLDPAATLPVLLKSIGVTPKTDAWDELARLNEESTVRSWLRGDTLPDASNIRAIASVVGKPSGSESSIFLALIFTSVLDALARSRPDEVGELRRCFEQARETLRPELAITAGKWETPKPLLEDCALRGARSTMGGFALFRASQAGAFEPFAPRETRFGAELLAAIDVAKHLGADVASFELAERTVMLLHVASGRERWLMLFASYMKRLEAAIEGKAGELRLRALERELHEHIRFLERFIIGDDAWRNMSSQLDVIHDAVRAPSTTALTESRRAILEQKGAAVKELRVAALETLQALHEAHPNNAFFVERLYYLQPFKSRTRLRNEIMKLTGRDVEKPGYDYRILCDPLRLDAYAACGWTKKDVQLLLP